MKWLKNVNLSSKPCLAFKNVQSHLKILTRNGSKTWISRPHHVLALKHFHQTYHPASQWDPKNNLLSLESELKIRPSFCSCLRPRWKPCANYCSCFNEPKEINKKPPCKYPSEPITNTRSCFATSPKASSPSRRFTSATQLCILSMQV